MNQHDRALVRGAFAGRTVAFAPEDGADIHADTIRALLLGRAPDGEAIDEGFESPPRVSVSGARIVGGLDLRDLGRPDGTPLPSLELVGCIFDEPLDLSHAALRRLSLAGSRFELLDARSARIDGNLDLGDVGPLRPDGPCRVDLFGVRVTGDVGAPRASLRAVLRPRHERDYETGDRHAALDLRMARIEGDIALQPGFTAHGGVNLRGARVTGSLWLGGAELEAGETFPLDCGAARIDGSVRLAAGIGADGRPAAFRARGFVHMWGVTVGGMLSMGGARVEPVPPSPEALAAEREPEHDWCGITLMNATVGGAVDMSVESVTGMDGDVPFATAVEGVVWLDGANVGGGFDLSGARIADDLTAIGARIGGDATLAEFDETPSSFGDIHFQDLDVGGSLRLAGEAGAVRLDRARVAGFLSSFARLSELALVDGFVGADVSLRMEPKEDGPAELSFLDARVGGMLTFAGEAGVFNGGRVRVEKNCELLGRLGAVALADASIGGFLNLRGDTGPLFLERLRVGTHCYVVGDTGDLTATNAVVGGDLWIETGRDDEVEAADDADEADASDAADDLATDDVADDAFATPDIRFLDAEIGGLVTLAGRSAEVNFGRARVGKSFEVRGWTGDVTLTDASIGGGARLSGHTGPLQMNRIRVDGHCTITATTGDISAVDADVGGDLWLGDSDALADPVDLSFLDAKIGGLLTLAGRASGLNLERAVVGKSVHVAGQARKLTLKSASIGGDLWFRDTSSVGTINLIDTRIGANFGLFGVIGTPLSEDVAINGIALQVAGEVEISGATVHGSLLLRDMVVRQNFLMRRSALRARFEAPRLHVGGDLEISAVQFHGYVGLSQAHIEGRLRVEDTDLVWSGDLRKPAVIDLDDARIDTELSIVGVPAPGDRRVGRANVLLERGGVLAMRSLDLPFYPGWRLVEALVHPAVIEQLGDVGARGMKHPGIVGFLWRRPWIGGRGEVLLLTGSDAPIVELNSRLGPMFRLSEPADAERYLQFYSSYVWGELGAYRSIQPGDPGLDELRPLTDDDEAEPPQAWQLEPITALRTASHANQFVVRYSLRYGDTLYAAVAAIRPDGQVDLVSRDAVGRLPSASSDRWVSPFRFSDGQGESGAGFPHTVARPDEWRHERGRRLARLSADLAGTFGRPVKLLRLEDARADRLDDRDGRAWSDEARLRLDGFTYERAHSRSDGATNPLAQAGRLGDLRRMRREDAIYRCTTLRVRRLRSHTGLWLVEVASAFRAGQRSDDDPGRYRRGTTAFLWAGPGKVLHLDDRSAMADSLAELPGRTLDSDEAVLDYLRLHGCLARTERLVEPGDPALPDGSSAVTRIALDPDGVAHRVEGRFLGPDGLHDCRFEIDGDGTVVCAAAGQATAPRAGWRERAVGPFRTVEAEGDGHLDDFAGSPWGNDDWETLLPSDDEEQRQAAGSILRDIVPAIRDRLADDAMVAAEDAADHGGTGPSSNGVLASLGGGGLLRSLRRRFDNRDARTVSRLEWLRLQYPDGKPTLDSYHSHPYEVLAGALRNEGEDRAARRILSEKLRIETRIEKWMRKPGRKLFNYFFGAFFDFGLSSGRALLATAGLLAVGWAGVAWLNDNQLLVVDFTPSATMVVDSPSGVVGGAPTREMALALAEPGRAEPRVPCGDNISNLVFAADHMVPVLEFGQRHRCQVTGARPPGAEGWWLSPDLWEVALTLYSVLGAIFVSIALLTVSGVLRRHAES